MCYILAQVSSLTQGKAEGKESPSGFHEALFNLPSSCLKWTEGKCWRWGREDLRTWGKKSQEAEFSMNSLVIPTKPYAISQISATELEPEYPEQWTETVCSVVRGHPFHEVCLRSDASHWLSVLRFQHGKLRTAWLFVFNKFILQPSHSFPPSTPSPSSNFTSAPIPQPTPLFV